jgi:membrane protein YdbS with pleckstrin-like domain
MIGSGLWLLDSPDGDTVAGIILIVAGVALLGIIYFGRGCTSWSITSDRVVEQRGAIGKLRREMELTDVRSIQVARMPLQRIFGLGSVMVASAASADFLIWMNDVRNCEQIAEMLRQARLKRLA